MRFPSAWVHRNISVVFGDSADLAVALGDSVGFAAVSELITFMPGIGCANPAGESFFVSCANPVVEFCCVDVGGMGVMCDAGGIEGCLPQGVRIVSVPHDLSRT